MNGRSQPRPLVETSWGQGTAWPLFYRTLRNCLPEGESRSCARQETAGKWWVRGDREMEEWGQGVRAVLSKSEDLGTKKN